MWGDAFQIPVTKTGYINFIKKFEKQSQFPYFFGTFDMCHILIKYHSVRQGLPTHIITLKNIFSTGYESCQYYILIY